MEENGNKKNEDEGNRFGLGVFACFFNEDYTKIMLLYRNAEKRARNGADWGNVGGVVEYGETSLQGALREIYEEVGLSLSPSDLKLISVKETLNFMPHLQAVHFVYSTSISENTPILLNAHATTLESEAYKWFSLDDLPDKTIDSKDELRRWRDLARNGSSIMHIPGK